MRARLQIVVVTGMSGAGKSTALRALEDLGYFCVDNLPVPMVAELVSKAETRPDILRVALGMDARGRVFGEGAAELRGVLEARGYDVSVLVLDATDEALVRRFSESRRPHPLAAGRGVVDGIADEREALWQIRAQADRVVDTTLLSVHELRRLLQDHYGGERLGTSLAVRLISFGFRFGIPADADMVLDVRFLPNPHFVRELRPRSGLDDDVAAFVLSHAESEEFLVRAVDFLSFLLPFYRREGKSYLTLAVGCTGGRHRSVALVEALATRLAIPDAMSVTHRDVFRLSEPAGTSRVRVP
jgi:UPF0042 nucleotide-binding protein